MNRILFISLFLLSYSFYGNGQVVLPSAEKVEIRESNIDSVTHYKSPISVYIDVNKLEANDTLVISGSFHDCGEWGGHLEHIYISRKKSNLYCWLKIDSCLCCNKLQKIHSYIPADKNNFKKNSFLDTIILNKSKRKLIADYFIYFGHIGEKWTGNSFLSNDFSIVKNGNETYSRKDPLGEWAGFINLKKKIFLK